MPSENQVGDGEEEIAEAVHGDLVTKRECIQGQLVYEGVYRAGKKIGDRLIPDIQDAFLSEDKYYLKIHFPLFYAGKMQIRVDGHSDYVLTAIAPQTHQLMVNDALDLDSIDFVFDYFPAAGDTLIGGSYVYRYVIME